MFGAPYTENVV